MAPTRSRREVKLTELLRLIPFESVQGSRDGSEVSIRGVAVDSREVEERFVFVAIEGETTDGHLFLDDAVARGAAAIVSERAPDSNRPSDGTIWVQTPDARGAAGVLAAMVAGQPAKKMDLIGVTGTNGKTTTAYLVDGLLSRLASPSAMMGTVVAKIGGRSWPTRHTTPEAPVLQDFLARAYEEGCRHGVLEVSSHGLKLARLEGMEFEAAVFTNLSRDHLDFHRDMEDYFSNKRLLFTRYLRPTGTAIVNVDDAYGERLASEISSRVVTYGKSGLADITVREIEASLSGTRVVFRENESFHEIRSALLGRYNAFNLVAAFTAVRAFGFADRDILESLQNIPGAPGRFEKVRVDLPFDVVVDYAHTDDALRKLLEAARPLTAGKLWVVFGCGGERDRSKRPLMGDVAARLADRVVLTSDNPRREDPIGIIREIQLGVKGRDVQTEPDRRRAISLALEGASAGDLVVIAGKGHEPYQIVGSEVLAFDDREVVREIAKEMGS